MSLNFGPWNFQKSQKLRFKDNAVSIRYISINFDRKFNQKKKKKRKNHNSLFLRDQMQRTGNMLEALQFCFNSCSGNIFGFDFCVEQVVIFLFVIIDSSLKFHVMRLLMKSLLFFIASK